MVGVWIATFCKKKSAHNCIFKSFLRPQNPCFRPPAPLLDIRIEFYVCQKPTIFNIIILVFNIKLLKSDSGKYIVLIVQNHIEIYKESFIYLYCTIVLFGYLLTLLLGSCVRHRIWGSPISSRSSRALPQFGPGERHYQDVPVASLVRGSKWSLRSTRRSHHLILLLS